MDNLINKQMAIDAMTDDNIIRNMDSVYDSALHRIKRSVIRILAELPSTQSKNYGNWICTTEYMLYPFKCPNCGEYQTKATKLCPSCGADMKV